MKKYLREIEVSAMILMFIGIIMNLLGKADWSTWVILIAIALWLIEVVYKAFKWEEYRRDNILNIVIMSGAIIAIMIFMLITR